MWFRFRVMKRKVSVGNEDNYVLCNGKETEFHLLNNCPSRVNLIYTFLL